MMTQESEVDQELLCERIKSLELEDGGSIQLVSPMLGQETKNHRAWTPEEQEALDSGIYEW